jgi:ABC-2 type transport system permease protein
MAIVTLFGKEMREQWRTRRLLVLASVFLFFGLLSPITAQLTPALMDWMAETMPGVVIQLPPPTAADATAQYIKNLSQIIPLVVLLVAMGSVVGERERGTLPMVLAKPVPRGAVLACKGLGLVALLAVSLFLGAAAAYYYSQLLFGGPELGGFLLMNLVAGLYLLVVLALTFLASTMAASTVMAGALAFVFWFVMIVVGALPRIGRASPTALLNWAAQLGLGQAFDGEWLALGVSLALIVLSLALAWLHFRRQEF